MRILKYKAIGIAIVIILSALEASPWLFHDGSMARGADAVEILRLRGARVLDANGWEIIDGNGTRAVKDTVITRPWVRNLGISGREYIHASNAKHVNDALRIDATGPLKITISRTRSLGRHGAWWNGSFEEMARIAELDNVVSLNLDVVLSGPDDLAFLSDVKGLRQLALYLSGEIHESSLASLAHCRDVRSLTIFSLKMKAECLKPIATMDGLESVQIAVMRLDPIVVDYLCELRQLRSVTLSGIRLTDEACRKLGEMPNLEELQLNGAGMSDEGRAIFRQTNQRAERK